MDTVPIISTGACVVFVGEDRTIQVGPNVGRVEVGATLHGGMTVYADPLTSLRRCVQQSGRLVQPAMVILEPVGEMRTMASKTPVNEPPRGLKIRAESFRVVSLVPPDILEPTLHRFAVRMAEAASIGSSPNAIMANALVKKKSWIASRTSMEKVEEEVEQQYSILVDSARNYGDGDKVQAVIILVAEAAAKAILGAVGKHAMECVVDAVVGAALNFARRAALQAYIDGIRDEALAQITVEAHAEFYVAASKHLTSDLEKAIRLTKEMQAT